MCYLATSRGSISIYYLHRGKWYRAELFIPNPQRGARPGASSTALDYLAPAFRAAAARGALRLTLPRICDIIVTVAKVTHSKEPFRRLAPAGKW